MITEPRHDKTNKVSVRPAKIQISLGIRPVSSESSLCAQWVAKDPRGFFMTQIRLGIARRTLIMLVLSCRGSYYHYFRMINSPAPESHYILYFLGSRKNIKVKN